MRDLEAAAIEAAILIDRGNPAGAIEATKSHLNRVPQIKDKARARALQHRVHDRAAHDAARPRPRLEILRKAVGRAKELGLSPNEESPLRAAMALTYVQSRPERGRRTPRSRSSAKFADEPDLRPLAKAAAAQPRDPPPDAGPRTRTSRRRSSARPRSRLGGPTLDRIAPAGPYLALAEMLVDQGKPKEALKFIREAATVAEDLGIRLEEVRLPTTTRRHGRVASPSTCGSRSALGNYQTGPDWAGFEPVFLVTERRLQDVLAKGAPEEKAPADMARAPPRVRSPGAQAPARAAGTRPPISEEEARRILAFRKVMIDEAWSRAPTFALRQFPRAGSIKRARDNYCGPDGAVFGASVDRAGRLRVRVQPRPLRCSRAIDARSRRLTTPSPSSRPSRRTRRPRRPHGSRPRRRSGTT